MKRALLIGDSLAAPRPKRGQPLDCTWPALIKSACPHIDVWQRCRPGIVTDEVLGEFHLFSESLDAFQYLVVQTGIADCCPRPYPLWMNKLFLFLGGRSLVNRISKMYPWLLKFRSRSWLTPSQFGGYLEEVVRVSLERSPAMQVILIAVGEPCNRLLETVGPTSIAYQRQFNQAMNDLAARYADRGAVQFIDPYKDHLPSDLFIDDGHHLSTDGHRLIAQEILRVWNEQANAYNDS